MATPPLPKTHFKKNFRGRRDSNASCRSGCASVLFQNLTFCILLVLMPYPKLLPGVVSISDSRGRRKKVQNNTNKNSVSLTLGFRV